MALHPDALSPKKLAELLERLRTRAGDVDASGMPFSGDLLRHAADVIEELARIKSATAENLAACDADSPNTRDTTAIIRRRMAALRELRAVLGQ